MTLWLIISIAAALAALAIAGAYLATVRRSRLTPVPIANLIKGIPVYLRDEYVMGLYQQGDFEALEREVEQTSRHGTEGNVGAEVRGVGARAARKDEEEKVTRYIRKEQPITVIRVIVDDLVRTNNIVAVDLIDMRFDPGAALDQALRGSRQRTAHLRDLDTWVLVRGRFREIARTSETVTFAAPYEGSAPVATAPRVNITCVADRLRHVPVGSFLARCLGRVQWDPETEELSIDPIAIFR